MHSRVFVFIMLRALACSCIFFGGTAESIFVLRSKYLSWRNYLRVEVNPCACKAFLLAEEFHTPYSPPRWRNFRWKTYRFFAGPLLSLGHLDDNIDQVAGMPKRQHRAGNLVTSNTSVNHHPDITVRTTISS